MPVDHDPTGKDETEFRSSTPDLTQYLNPDLEVIDTPKPWQNRLELHEKYTHLSGSEAAMLLGSSLAKDRLDYDEMSEAGTIGDHAYDDETRKIDGALAELTTLQITPYDTESDFVSELSVRANALKQEIEALPFGTAEHQKLADRRAAVAYLESQYEFLIRDPQEVAVNSVRVSDRGAARRDWINQAINAHNSHLDSLATSEATNTQPQVTETSPNTTERERQARLAEVAQAARGATRIFTDIPSGILLKSTEGDHLPIDGFNSFGDGLPPNDNQFRQEMLTDPDSVEALLFEPVVTTDQQEALVKVAYQFNGNRVGGTIYDGPIYRTKGGRGGNMLFVEATLPKSVADKLQQETLQDPTLAREFAHTLALNNGITEEVWNDTVRPPFDQLPDGWELSVASMQKDTQFRDVRHNISDQHKVRIGQ